MANIVFQLKKGRSAARAVRSQSGKSLLSQLVEIARLRRLGLSPGDYYRYRLFDDTRFGAGQKREYTGSRFQDAVYPFVNDPGLIARTNLPRGWGGAVDKLLFDCLMQRSGVPTPRILAVFDVAGIEYGDVQTCRTRAGLERVIRAQRESGFFLKPARAHTGYGAMAVERVEADTVVLTNGQRLGIEALLEHACAYERVLVQELLAPHPVLAAAAGSTLATLRLSVLRRQDSSTIHRTVLRIPTGTNMVDNFDGGNTGNLVGWVDPPSGRVVRVYGGAGITQARVVHHPDTGARLEGLLLPDWTEASALVRRASRLLAAMPFQSWDLALTDRGPMMIEINDISSQDVLQLAGPPGMLDAELCSFLREQGFRWRYPHA